MTLFEKRDAFALVVETRDVYDAGKIRLERVATELLREIPINAHELRCIVKLDGLATRPLRGSGCNRFPGRQIEKTDLFEDDLGDAELVLADPRRRENRWKQFSLSLDFVLFRDSFLIRTIALHRFNEGALRFECSVANAVAAVRIVPAPVEAPVGCVMPIRKVPGGAYPAYSEYRLRTRRIKHL